MTRITVKNNFPVIPGETNYKIMEEEFFMYVLEVEIAYTKLSVFSRIHEILRIPRSSFTKKIWPVKQKIKDLINYNK